jgi:hypothetical protein
MNKSEAEWSAGQRAEKETNKQTMSDWATKGEDAQTTEKSCNERANEPRSKKHAPEFIRCVFF